MPKQYDNGDISKLLDIMKALRDKATGCPWDLEQDFASIAPYTIEEAYEVADCIERAALEELPDELGDLLLQVVFHSQMAAEDGRFSFADVVERICDKMIRRHPHVFGDDPARSGAEVAASWQAIKRAEQPQDQSLMDGVALALPALMRAAKLGRRAASVGFDWPEAAPVRNKIDEELDELDQAVAGSDPRRIESELGDLLFAIVNYSRHLDVDPERALRRASDRFSQRFRHVEARVIDEGGDWQSFSVDALESFWREAKAREAG